MESRLTVPSLIAALLSFLAILTYTAVIARRRRRDSFAIRVNDIFYIKGRGMVLTGHVESGKVYGGGRVLLRTPTVSVLGVLAGVERNRKVVPCANAGEDIALLIRDVYPERLIGGVERTDQTVMSPWKVIDVQVEPAPSRSWEIWK